MCFFNILQQLVNVHCVSSAVILGKHKARGFADVHAAADFGADMARSFVQGFHHRVRAAFAPHHTDVHLGDIQVRGNIKPGHSQQTTRNAGVLHFADNGDQLAFHILCHTAMVFAWHNFTS